MNKGAIFDLDGTILESNSFWNELDGKFLKQHGLLWDEEYAQAVHTLDNDAAASFVKEHYQLQMSSKDIVLEWEEMAYEAYRNDLELKEDALEVLMHLKTNHYTIALVTISPPVLYEAAINRLGIDQFFDYKFSLKNSKYKVKNTKLFKYIIDEINTRPNETIGFEDSFIALQAMHSIGIRTYAIRDLRNINHLNKYQLAGFNLHTWQEVLNDLIKQ